MDYFVHGLFAEEKTAALAVQALIDAHFSVESISALLHAQAEVQESTPVYTTGVARGAALGAILGLVGGGLVATGGLLAAGPVLGGAFGAFAGAVGGLGRWKDEIEFPRHIDRPMILVGVSTTKENIERARSALAAAHPVRVHVSGKDEACTEVETGTLSQNDDEAAER